MQRLALYSSMLRILAGTILSLILSFSVPALYHSYLSDVVQGFYSSHFEYDIEAPEQGYYLVPLYYNSWFAFRDGVTENYGRKLYPKSKVLHLRGMETYDYALKSGNRYYVLANTETPNYYALVPTDLGVNPVIYLVRYLLLYMLLIIVPLAISAALNKSILKVPNNWRLIIVAVSAMFGTTIVGYVYLRDWWTLFNGWILS